MEISIDLWRPEITHWEKITPQAYTLIYENAKERYEDILSESESITTKSIKMITALAAFFGFVIKLLIDKHIPLKYASISIVPFLAEAVMLFILIAPKYVRFRGLPPRKLFPKNLDDDTDIGSQEQLILYTRIVLIQNNIDIMLLRNESRAKLYKWALIVFLLLVTGTTTGVAYLFS